MSVAESLGQEVRDFGHTIELLVTLQTHVTTPTLVWG